MSEEFTYREAIKLRMQQIHERQMAFDKQFGIAEVEKKQLLLEEEYQSLLRILLNMDESEAQKSSNQKTESSVDDAQEDVPTTSNQTVINEGYVSESPRNDNNMIRQDVTAHEVQAPAAPVNEETTVTSQKSVESTPKTSLSAPDLSVDEKVDVVVDIIKSSDVLKTGKEIQDEYRRRTGGVISNITQFMRAVMKKNPEITKPMRGAYEYEEKKAKVNK